MISHITISTPSAPASRISSRCDRRVSFFGFLVRLSRKAWSNFELIRPARWPLIWCDMPPVPKITTFKILGIGFDRLADRLAEHEAAVAGRRRILHHVDRERDHRARPFLRRAEHQVERHGEAVVDLHLVAQRQIELVEDHRLRDVRGELGMALHHRHRTRAPALVGDREFRRGAEREGRDDLHRERRGVVVVDADDDVGLGLARSTPWSARSPRTPAASTALRCDDCRSRRRSPARATTSLLR